MDIDERQEYYDLIEEEIQFTPQKGQKWVLTFEERHTFEHDILFHVYTQKGETMLLTYEIVDIIELDVKERLHKLSDTLSGNFRILMSTLKLEMPGELEQETLGKDGSRFKLTFAHKKEIKTYTWEFPKGNFKRIRPVLKLIWAVDQWRPGAKAMGWSGKDLKEGLAKLAATSPETATAERKWSKEQGKQKATPPAKGGKKGRLDPFGNIWEPMAE